MNNWIIEYDNDVGPNDEGFWEWWTVTNGNQSIRCHTKENADWLLSKLKDLPYAEVAG